MYRDIHRGFTQWLWLPNNAVMPKQVLPDVSDVVLMFNQMQWITANEPVSAFDFNGNGRIDFNDIVKLFGEV